MRSDAAAKLPVVFFGTSAFAVPSLAALADSHDVRAVFTQPDRPAGRGLHLRPSPIKTCALARGLDVRTPERIDRAFVDEVERLRPRLLACVSYGKILPASLLSIDGMVALNVHPSLLPEYRGASPMQTALRDGRTLTGVTLIWMSTKMDAGDIALQREVAIAPDEDFGELHDRLASIGAEMLVEAAALLRDGALSRTPQDESRATFTRPLEREDVRIDTSGSVKSIVDLVRSASPSPGAWLIYEGKRLKVIEARAEPPGADAMNADGPAIRAADGMVRLLRVVPEGKRLMSGSEFARSLGQRS